jgi:hypothetical protein
MMKGPKFEALLDRLESDVAASGKEEDDRKRLRWTLSSLVLQAGGVYDGLQLSAEIDAKSAMHELPTLLARVKEIVTSDVNYSDALVALGAPANLILSPDRERLECAVERHDAFVAAIDDLARAAPLPPPRPGRGPGPEHTTCATW